MAGARFLDFLEPLAAYLPSVTGPQRKVPFNQKLLWTGLVVLIFLVMGEIPLYGLTSADSADPLMWLRMMTASNRGTLMELGIAPIVTSGMVLQLMTGTGLLDLDPSNPRDAKLANTAEKLLAFMLAVGQATSYVLAGMYGVPSQLGYPVVLLLIVQLCGAGIIVILLDELLQKGYGIGSGSQLFITTNVCEQVIWKAFSPSTINSGRGYEMEGAVVGLIHLMSTRRSMKYALIEAFTRAKLPNMSQLVATIGVFLFAVYLQGFRCKLPLVNAQNRMPVGLFPVRLLYTSNTPVMLQSALTGNIALLSRLLFTRYPETLLTRIIGTWDALPGTTELRAVNGLMYYLQPPGSIKQVMRDPLQFTVYALSVIILCALFSQTWTEISRSDVKSVARQLRTQGVTIGGKEANPSKALKHIIPTAAILGGAVIGALSVTCDLLGTLGQGTGILLTVTTLHGYYESVVEELK